MKGREQQQWAQQSINTEIEMQKQTQGRQAQITGPKGESSNLSI